MEQFAQPELAMSRKASREALLTIENSGLLSKRRKEVYVHLHQHGPLTAQQFPESIPGAWKRLSELEHHGLVEKLDREAHGKVGSRVIRWDVTGRTIPKPLAHPHKDDDMKAENKRLRKLLEDLLTPSNHPCFDGDHDSALLNARDRIDEINKAINSELNPPNAPTE